MPDLLYSCAAYQPIRKPLNPVDIRRPCLLTLNRRRLAPVLALTPPLDTTARSPLATRRDLRNVHHTLVSNLVHLVGPGPDFKVNRSAIHQDAHVPVP